MNPTSLKSAVPVLKPIWLKTYLKAVEDGYRWRPSGVPTDDPHCAAMATLCSTPKGVIPSQYGGDERWKRTSGDCRRWSATRLAALSTFTAAVGLGLTLKNAARVVSTARRAARRSLGIRDDDHITIEAWLTLSSNEQEDRSTRLARRIRWSNAYHLVQMAHGPRQVAMYARNRDGSREEIAKWFYPPFSKEVERTLATYRKDILQDLLKVADLYGDDALISLIKDGEFKAADERAKSLDKIERIRYRVDAANGQDHGGPGRSLGEVIPHRT